MNEQKNHIDKPTNNVTGTSACRQHHQVHEYRGSASEKQAETERAWHVHCWGINEQIPSKLYLKTIQSIIGTLASTEFYGSELKAEDADVHSSSSL